MAEEPTKSTAARKDVQTSDGGIPGPSQSVQSDKGRPKAGTQALPVDTHASGSSGGKTAEFDSANGGSNPSPETIQKRKSGRPSTGFSKTEYQRLYTADQRTIKRLGLNCSVKTYRESLNGKPQAE